MPLPLGPGHDNQLQLNQLHMRYGNYDMPICECKCTYQIFIVPYASYRGTEFIAVITRAQVYV